MLFCFEKLKSLSSEFSRVFDYSEKDGETRFRYLVGTCLDNTSISEYCERHKAVSADTILKLGNMPVAEMVEKCNRLIRVATKIGLQSGMFKGCDASIDFHDVKCNGKRTEHSLKTMVDGKIQRCFRFAVSAITGRKRFLITGIQLYRENDSNMVMVDRLLDTVPDEYKLILMDRFFCGVDVFNRVEERGKHYLTPYKINNTTDELYLESLLDGEKVKPYQMRKGSLGYKTVNMYLEPHPDDEYHAYTSDLKDIIIDEHYPFRWNIENQFRTKQMVKPVTSTTHESFRVLLITIALILACLWKILVLAREHITVKTYKRELLAALQTTLLFDDAIRKATKD